MRMTRTLGLVVAMLTIETRVTAEPSATPRQQWAFDGGVYATARVGNTLYAGGDFRNVVPLSGVLGNFYAVSPSSGAVVPSVLPRIDGIVRVVLPDGGGGYYVHGNFTIGTGHAVGRVVHIRPDGSVDPQFNSPPQLTGAGGMFRVGPSLVLGGYYTLNGAPRPLS